MRSLQSFSKGVLLLFAALLVFQPLMAEKFNSRGKRDPFYNLFKAQQEETIQVGTVPPLSQRPPGLAGLLISEVTVSGTAGNSNTHLVVLKGIDGETYIANEGSKLYDGYVRSISSSEVVFVRQGLEENEELGRVVKQVLTEKN